MQTYIVKRGDTMSSIAADQMPGDDSIYRKNGRLTALLRANPKINPANRVYVGTVIILPALSEIDIREPTSVVPASVVPDAHPDASADSNAVVAEAQVPTVAASKEASFSPHLDVGLGASFINLNSRDLSSGSSANFASDLNSAVNVSLVQPFTNAMSVYGRVDYREVKFQQPTTQSSIQQAGSQKGFAAGFVLETNDVRIGLEAGIRQELFPRASATNVYTFDRLTIPYARILLGAEPVHLGASKIGIEGHYEYLGESNSGPQRANAGHALGGEVYWDYKFKSRRKYRLGLAYSKVEQNTNLSEQRQTNIGLNFNLIWPLGD